MSAFDLAWALLKQDEYTKDQPHPDSALGRRYRRVVARQEKGLEPIRYRIPHSLLSPYPPTYPSIRVNWGENEDLSQENAPIPFRQRLLNWFRPYGDVK